MKFRDPVRPVNLELLHDLEVCSTKVYPLPGGTGRRWDTEVDSRLKHLQGSAHGEEITYYEHIATLRAPRARSYYVAFRETMDALLVRSQDKKKFPEWIMKDPAKQKERMIYIYRVKKHPTELPIIRSHEDWLEPLGSDQLFDSLAYYLYKQQVITWEQYV